MRFIVLGAGAVGGVVGGRLFQHGHDVVLVARGEHARVVAEEGLTLASPSGVDDLAIPVTERVDKVAWTGSEVVLLAVKSQHSEEALGQLAMAAPSSTPLVCMQNGVCNELAALRLFSNVYGICVMCPASFLKPGVVVAESSPVTALLDIGRYPDDPAAGDPAAGDPAAGDPVARDVAAALNASTMESVVRPDIMRWKYAKLLRNLANAVDALCGPAGRSSELVQMARKEGEMCFAAAGIPYASEEEDDARRGNRLHPSEVVGFERGGSSTWQSLARSEGSTEVDYLNGEVVLLGRLHGVPTPVNELLQRLLNQMARAHSRPSTMTPEEVLSLLPE